MVSSARNPNESYAQRVKKASTSSSNQQQSTTNALPPPPPPTTTTSALPPLPPPPTSSTLKPPRVNVWAERIREQQAHAPNQQMPRQRSSPSPKPTRDETIQPRSPAPDLSVKLAILDQQDEHDPFVVRIPPHLSRRSSSSTNPVPATDPTAWPHLPAPDPPGNASSTNQDSPFFSALPSRQDSATSFRHHAYASSLPRVQNAFSHHSHSASQSGTESRSGSSASSPRLQIRARTLPQDDPLPLDLRLDHPHRRSKRASPALPDAPNHIPSPCQIDSVLQPTDPSYYRRPPVPPLQDMSPRYTHNFVPPYAQFPPPHGPGHASPPYIPPSGQGTPPYPHYPPYPAYMYGHPSLFWGDVPPHSHTHFQNQPPVPSNHINASEHAVPHKIEFGSVSPAITTEPGSSRHSAQGQNGWQPKPSRSVVFGTIDVPDPQDDVSAPPPSEEQRTEAAIESATEQFATFSIGVGPDEPGPSRLASRKSSVRSLPKTISGTNDPPKDASVPASSKEVNGIKKLVKWEFGTTCGEDLDEPRPSSPPSPTPLPPPNHQDESGTDDVEDRPDLPSVPSSHNVSRVDGPVDESDAGSPVSDVWVVKNYGYGFGDHGGSGNAPDVVRWEMRGREQERTREYQRHWDPPRQSSWRNENDVEEGREGWESQARHVRPRRGSFPGYGGHERGGFAGRRGRPFGRFHGRARGFFHHQRPGSYSYPPPPPPPPLPPFEVLPPGMDMVNGYGPYPPPELGSYEAVPPVSQPRVPLPSAAYPVDATQNSLLAQLEYYLSPQNMAQDFYLRQRMDNEGWIPISLLASFNRVRQLHTDVDIVKDTLSQSGTVEVSGEWVRMGGRQWEMFVLPNAPPSVVTGGDRDPGQSPGTVPYPDDDAYAELGEVEGEHGEMEGDCDGEDCEGDDEDDDIEFVIGEEAEGSWMPVPERKQ